MAGLGEPSTLLWTEPEWARPRDITLRVKVDRMLRVRANPLDTLDGLKERITGRIHVPPSQQRLFFGLSRLRDGARTLESYGLRDGSVLDLVYAFDDPDSAMQAQVDWCLFHTSPHNYNT